MRVAIIGCGGMGSHHFHIYKSMQDVEVVAVVDIDLERTQAMTGQAGIRVYRTLEDLFAKEQVAIISVCTPSYMHREHAVAAMEAGCHVLCEKPISLTVEDAAEMIEASKRCSVQFMVGHVIRFWPEYVVLKELFINKTYGELRHAEFSRISEMPRWSDWFKDRNLSGGAPLDFHIHDTDFIQYLFGTPETIQSYQREDDSSSSYIRTQFTYGSALVESECGWFDAPIPFEMTYRVDFEHAVVRFRNGELAIYEKGGKTQIVQIEDKSSFQSGINIHSTDGYANELRYFVECVKANKRPEISTPESSLLSLQLVLAELESSRTGRVLAWKQGGVK